MNREVRDSLAQVQELLGRATPGEWRVGTYGGGQTVQHWVLYGPAFHAGTSVRRAAQDMELAALSVNFLRTHGPELMKMLDRHGAGDAEDAARYRWLSRKVSAHALHGIGYTFAFPTHLTLPAPPSVMGGSVAQHLDAAIDAARAEASR